MNENEMLEDIFGETKLWKGKYKLTWCDLCQVASIKCPVPTCHGSSCNGGGCEECLKDDQEWKNTKQCVENYLTEDEIKTWHKCLQLKEFILESLAKNETEINFKKLKEDGELSKNTEKMFEKELNL